MVDHKLVIQDIDAYVVTEKTLALTHGVTDDENMDTRGGRGGNVNTSKGRGDTRDGCGRRGRG